MAAALFAFSAVHYIRISLVDLSGRFELGGLQCWSYLALVVESMGRVNLTLITSLFLRRLALFGDSPSGLLAG